MTMSSLKEPSTLSYPKTFLSITALVGGLAVFLILASSILVSQPIGSAFRGYYYAIDHSGKLDFASRINETVSDLHNDIGLAKNINTSDSSVSRSDETISDSLKSEDTTSVGGAKPDGSSNTIDRNPTSVSQNEKAIPKSGRKEVDASSSAVSDVTESVQHANPHLSASANNSSTQTRLNNIANTTLEAVPSLSPLLNNTSGAASVNSGCDLYHGKWVYESTGPLYKNDSCPVLTQMQNCQGNGRPDKGYENWQWKPDQCDLPRFDAKRFLELMRGKTLAFIGDSVARNQMESMLCILWQVEVPKNRGNRRMQRYYFKSTNTMIIRIWSSWLLHQTSEPYDFAPGGVVKLHLDASDENFMELIPTFDVVVLSSGHWFAKQSVYILNNEIVGGQLWWPDKSRPMKINNVEAFGVSVETVLTAIVTHPNYNGLTIVRSYSPDHYEGGAWNTGGSCTGKVKPALDGELPQNGFTNIMHEKQVMGFNHAVKKQTNKSKLRLMDITEVFSYRHDGHPGPYRSPDPNKITKRGPDGRPPPQDCLHWCMPGPVDVWNEMVLEIVRREAGT